MVNEMTLTQKRIIPRNSYKPITLLSIMQTFLSGHIAEYLLFARGKALFKKKVLKMNERKK